MSKGSRQRSGLFKIFILAILLGALVSVSAYLLIQWYILNYTKGIDELLEEIMLYTSSAFGVLITVVFYLLGVILSKGSNSRSHAKELKNFKDFTDALHAARNESEVYETLFNFITNIIPVSQVTVFYRKIEGNNDIVWQRITNEKLPLCNMSHKYCPLVLHGRECFIDNIEDDITCAYQLPEYKSGSYICLAINENDKVGGILQLYSKKKGVFNEAMISTIRTYIEVVVPVISSIRTMNELNKEASTDKLTKVYNRTYLEPFLTGQIEDSKATGKLLSLILLDIDHFKKVNDNYGHNVGDYVLVVFAQIIQRCIRRSDLLARYGGEEFIVVLPNTDIETANHIAQRIRESVEEERMPIVNGQKLPNITCSLGVSTFPILGFDKTSLIKSADIALYKAKESGRNNVKIYTREMGKIGDSN